MPITHPPVTVIMATYNGAAFLESQLVSIYNQNYPPAAVIVCDDGSVDNTPLILKRYAQKYGLQYHINQSRLGVVENFKKAVSLAEASHYIALADQDDIWLPDKLEQLTAALIGIDNRETPALAYSDLSIMDAEEKIIAPSFWQQWQFDRYPHTFQTLLFGNFITGCTVLMNPAMRQHFIQMPVDVEMHDAWMALIGFGFGKTIAISQPLVLYRKHQNNVAYIKDYTKEKGLRKLISFARKIIKGDDYLNDRMLIAAQFLQQYQQQLPAQNLAILQTFLSYKNKPYLFRKLYFEKIFRNLPTPNS